MDDLDSNENITKLDKENILGSVEALPDQCKDAWEKANEVDVSESYTDVKNVVMTGMGGSGLGARVIESVFAKELSIPLVRVNDYDIPPFCDTHTLVICSSYSGTTEEVLENAKQARDKNTKWMAIGTGNTLIDLAEGAHVPYYKIDPVFNPSNQPRMAIGYSVVGQLVLASKAGLFELKEENINEVVEVMKDIQNEVGQDVPFKKNPAKNLATKLKGKVIIYVASRHLVGAMHTINNQLNENAKNVSFDVQIPELNHHLMEGLKHPQTNSNNLFMFFANSNIYPDRIRKRYEVTMDIVEQNNIESFEYSLRSKNFLSQSFELIQFGAYVNFYLSMLYKQNPAPIPWVDYFKEKMGQPLGK
jgi:glucose/mannose-6-phosphate isomerase